MFRALKGQNPAVTSRKTPQPILNQTLLPAETFRVNVPDSTGLPAQLLPHSI